MPLVMIKSDPRAREKPCIRCGYSLRKVTDSIHCPECGLAVWLSLNNNDTLENSNPDWLRRSALALDCHRQPLAGADVAKPAVAEDVGVERHEQPLVGDDAAGAGGGVEAVDGGLHVSRLVAG